MKFTLPSGRNILVRVHHDKVEVSRKRKKLERRTTSVKITKLKENGDADWVLEGFTTCSEKDQFVKQEGRKFALLDLFDSDTSRAERLAPPSRIQEVLLLPRADRTALFTLICPKLSNRANGRTKRRAIGVEKMKKIGFEKIEAAQVADSFMATGQTAAQEIVAK